MSKSELGIKELSTMSDEEIDRHIDKAQQTIDETDEKPLLTYSLWSTNTFFHKVSWKLTAALAVLGTAAWDVSQIFEGSWQFMFQDAALLAILVVLFLFFMALLVYDLIQIYFTTVYVFSDRIEQHQNAFLFGKIVLLFSEIGAITVSKGILGNLCGAGSLYFEPFDSYTLKNRWIKGMHNLERGRHIVSIKDPLVVRSQIERVIAQQRSSTPQASSVQSSR